MEKVIDCPVCYDTNNCFEEVQETFSSYLYYSATSYSSLGVGDVYARGSLRLISSFEVINGLTLIAWSATFTYFAVQKMWEASGLPLHINCECCSKE